MNEKLNQWTAIASNLIGEIFDNSKHLIDINSTRLEPSVRFISTQLYLDCHFSSESALILIDHEKEWDAEIINRSIVEGTIKYLYILVPSEKEQVIRANEYWNILTSLSQVKRHERVKGFLDYINGASNKEFQALIDMLLTDEEINKKKLGLNKKERKQLENKWSFKSILDDFLKYDNGFKNLIHLYYSYGMSSHLIHKDGTGVGMVWERCMRDEVNKELVKMSHSARIVSDICTMATARSHQLHQSCSEPFEKILEIEKSYESFFNELNYSHKLFRENEYS